MPMDLPDRDEVIARLGKMIAETVRRSARAAQPLERTCVLLLVEVEDHRSLIELDASGGSSIDEEIARRLDRQVRSGDVLGRTAVDRYVVAASDVAPAVVGVLAERMRTAFAMPIALGDGLVSLPVEVAVEIAGDLDGSVDAAAVAAAMMQQAEAQLSRR